MQSKGTLIVPERKAIKIVPMMVLKPKANIPYREKALSAEPSGKGDVLCIEGFFGRIFRSDPDCVKDELEQYSQKYIEMCEKCDEDPAHKYYDTMCWNDLYYLHNLVPSIAGGCWGYTTSDDWRVPSIDWDMEYVEKGEWFEMFGEPYFYYNPKQYSVPFECYMEV